MKGKWKRKNKCLLETLGENTNKWQSFFESNFIDIFVPKYKKAVCLNPFSTYINSDRLKIDKVKTMQKKKNV